MGGGIVGGHGGVDPRAGERSAAAAAAAAGGVRYGLEAPRLTLHGVRSEIRRH